MKQYQFVLFDLDGTIADTSIGVINGIKYVEEKMKLSHLSEETYRKFIGPSNKESYYQYYGLTGVLLDRAIEYHKSYALEKGVYEAELYNGIREILDYLKNREILTAVVTLKQQASAEKMLQYLKLHEYFDAIVGDKGSDESKKDLIQRCLKEIDAANDNTVLIGDSKYDQKGASDSNMDFVGVTYGFGFQQKEDLSDLPYIAIASSTNELYRMIKERIK